MTTDSTGLAASGAVRGILRLVGGLWTNGLRPVLAWAYKFIWVLVHPRTCLRVAMALMRPEIRPIIEAESGLLFKYLGAYIAADLSRMERASILIEHYTFIRNHTDGDFFQKIINSRLELWRDVVAEHVYRIYLTFPRMTDDEGDLALVFEADGVDIYTLSFAIGPGSIVSRGPGGALYIARLQGKASALHLIRSATKNCLAVSPAALLLAAAEGVAAALKISHMIGIGASNQVKNASRLTGLEKAYDEFWIAVGGQRLDRDMYYLSVPSAPKPIQAIQRGHRRRALRKRQYRSLLTHQVCHAFGVQFLTPRIA